MVCHDYTLSHSKGYLAASHLPSHCVGAPSCSSMMKYGLGLNSIPGTRVRWNAYYRDRGLTGISNDSISCSRASSLIVCRSTRLHVRSRWAQIGRGRSIEGWGRRGACHCLVWGRTIFYDGAGIINHSLQPEEPVRVAALCMCLDS